MQNLENLELRTGRLILKVIGPSFVPQALAYYARNRAFLTQSNPTPSDDFYTLPYHQELKRICQLEKVVIFGTIKLADKCKVE